METEKKTDGARWCARPYVTAYVGPRSTDVVESRWTDWDHGRAWTSESFALEESWAFTADSSPRHLDLGSVSAFEAASIVRDNRYTEDENLDLTGLLALESLASWCVRRVLTYPASDGRVLVSSLDYMWEVWDLVLGDRWAVLGLAMPLVSQLLVTRDVVREFAGVWARKTFGPAFMPFDLASGWSRVERGTANRSGYSYSWGRSDSEWARKPEAWNAWR